jgi:hypothetical protein
VNRFTDVLHQLALVVRGDALAWIGIASLSLVESSGQGALARLLITGEDRSDQLPERSGRDLRVPALEPEARALLSGLESLRFSDDPALAGLVRVTLLAALASSPEAIREALARYRSLLQHARDGAGSGRVLTRQVIRQFVGGQLDQLVLWPLVAEPAAHPELVLSDLDALVPLLTAASQWGAGQDAKSAMLEDILRDGAPTLVFTNARASVRYLRRRLSSPIAWCTGERSGIDHVRLPREEVLSLFRNGGSDHPARAPRLLLATDVAAEGLDLPGLARVVHYDLPWTAVRLEQRSGRAFRIGSSQERVEVLRLLPPVPLERVLRREDILLEKEGLPRQLGLSGEPESPWRLRSRIARDWEGEPWSGGAGAIQSLTRGFVAGLRFGFAGGIVEEVVVARTDAGWSHDLATIAALLSPARTVADSGIPDPALLKAAVRQVAGLARHWLRTARTSRIRGPRTGAAARRVRRRLLALGRMAAAHRDQIRLGAIERGLRWLGRGRTAGEEMLLETWDRLPADALVRAASRASEGPRQPETEGVQLFGLLLLRRENPPG